MEHGTVRLSAIHIQNFKNVVDGNLDFRNPRHPHDASVLGLYGQNGSGKTALIDALTLLKLALSGKQLPLDFAEYINVDADHADLTYTFDVNTESGDYTAIYSLVLTKGIAPQEQNTIQSDPVKKFNAQISEETLSYSFRNGSRKYRMEKLMDTSKNTEIFTPKNKYRCLIGASAESSAELAMLRKQTRQFSRSFLFSADPLNKIRNHARVISEKQKEEYIRHVQLLEALVEYGNFGLFIVSTLSSGLISLKGMPISFKYREENGRLSLGSIVLPLDSTQDVPETVVSETKKVIDNVNVVLKQIVPGLTIGIRELEKVSQADGGIGERIELVSIKGNHKIALRYESEGIKKILSILQLLIVMFNDASVTVAIDELDSGIFEYLLGEILRVISEYGKGQLIFTSHNLRPLETIDRGYIAFTTVNPEHRYIRPVNIKNSHNLRSCYFRDIALGTDGEDVYNPTSNTRIAMAFREAGEGIE